MVAENIRTYNSSDSLVYMFISIIIIIMVVVIMMIIIAALHV